MQSEIAILDSQKYYEIDLYNILSYVLGLSLFFSTFWHTRYTQKSTKKMKNIGRKRRSLYIILMTFYCSFCYLLQFLRTLTLFVKRILLAFFYVLVHAIFKKVNKEIEKIYVEKNCQFFLLERAVIFTICFLFFVVVVLQFCLQFSVVF